MAEKHLRAAEGTVNNGRLLSDDILEQVTERSRRLQTPRIVRNWFTPMALVVALALLFSTGLYVVDLLFFDDSVTGLTAVEHYLAFSPEFIADALPALATTIVAVLGIVLTVIAIIVQLSSERYTGVAMMFLRDPVHVFMLSFYVVASLCALWLSVTLQADFVPRSLLLLVMAFTSLGLASMLPYFAYTFWFLAPGNIIERLRMRVTRLGKEGLAATADQEIENLQQEMLLQVDEITDIANNSIEGRDRIIAGDAVDALRDFLIDYIANKPGEDRAWYRLRRSVWGNAYFTGMDKDFRKELESRHLWVEWMTMQQYVGIYDEALDAMRGINAQIAINTRYFGEFAAANDRSDLLRMVFRFMNAYLRSAIYAGNPSTAGDVLQQYRLLLENILSAGKTDAACEGVGYLSDYGRLANDDDLFDVTSTVAYDIAAICQYAHTNELAGEDAILGQLLQLDAEGPVHGHRQQRGLGGVRRAQTKLAMYYMSAGEHDKARMIADDMRDMSPEALAAVRDDLAQAPPPHFWEVVDRGRNLHYLQDDELAQLGQFMTWVGGGPTDDDHPDGTSAGP